MIATSTRVGLASVLSAESRKHLTILARQGIRVCQRRLAKVPMERGTRLLGHLCDSLDRALSDLAVADLAVADHRIASLERALGASQVRIDELRAKIRAESFDAETVKREAPNLGGHERRTAQITAVRS